MQTKRIQLDRIQSIFKMKELGKKHRQIAKACGISASSVSDTLNLYKHHDIRIWEGMNCYEKSKYVWDKQKARAKSKNRFKGNLSDKSKRTYVITKLVDDNWSPEIISNKMQEEIQKKCSTNTIYRFIKTQRRDLRKYLYEKGKPRRQRVANRRSPLKKKPLTIKKYIETRPDIINSRDEFGHWEGDLIVGAKNGSKYVILSLIERQARKKIFKRMPNATAETTLGYLRAIFMNLPEHARKSITLDNGPEFEPTYMHKLEDLFKGFCVYYTEPYSPEQKGSDEHSNGRFRKYFPKKTDFTFVSNSMVQNVENKLNARPMKLLGYKTPQEVFDCKLQETTSFDSEIKIAA